MTVHVINHDSIEFGSTNANVVSHYSSLLNGVSVDDIKSNNIENRHSLLIDMACSGYSSLCSEYMMVREKRQTIFNNLRDKYKGTSLYVLKERECMELANDAIFNLYGWEF